MAESLVEVLCRLLAEVERRADAQRAASNEALDAGSEERADAYFNRALGLDVAVNLLRLETVRLTEAARRCASAGCLFCSDPSLPPPPGTDFPLAE